MGEVTGPDEFALEAMAALEREIERLFPAGSPGARALAHPLEQLRILVAAGEGAGPKVAPLLDTLEDVLESLMRGAGWPAAPT